MHPVIKKARVIIFSLMPIMAFCSSQPVSGQNLTAAKSHTFIGQLFIYFESAHASFCEGSSGGSDDVFGAIRFTEKGNVIYHLVDQQADTIRYFWGKYTYTDTSITYLLTHEYYYAGKWDARWDVSDPDYTKGHTRKIKSTEITLFKSKCQTYPFSHPYTKKEKKLAAKRYKSIVPYGIIYQPYYEPKSMQYFSWVFKQIPVLACL